MSLHSIGQRELAAIDGPRGTATVQAVCETSPVLAGCLVEHAFGTVFARTTLSRREREMASVVALAAMGGCEPQLELHIEAALRVGADRDELIALAEHLSVYAGYPRALNMLRILRSGLERHQKMPLGTLRKLQLRDMETELFDSGGDGPVMILVHALGLDWRMWRDVIPHLVDRYRVIAFDLRGFGSAGQARAAAAIDDYAVDLHALIDQLGGGPVHLVGLSLGGTIALKLASDQPELLTSLTVVAATAWPFAAFGERIDAARSEGVAAQIAPSLTRWFRGEDLARNGWAVRYARDCVDRADLNGWLAGWNALHALDIADELASIRVATRIIAGEADMSTPPNLMEGMKTIPASTFTVISDAPHMLSLTHPAELADLLLPVIG